MASSTYTDLKTKVENDLDLSEETFITSTEMLGYFNEGVQMIQDEVQTLYEDYYLNSYAVPLVSGTAAYAFPDDIYIQKIRGLIYDDGSKKYELRRFRKFAEITMVQSEDDLSFLIKNDGTLGTQFVLYPTPSVTSSSVLTMWYLRDAKKFTGDTEEPDDDICDLPAAFENVLVQYVRWKCRAKEGHPDTAMDLQDLQGMKQKMIDTLKDRVVDEDTTIMTDLSFYADFDNDTWGRNY